MVYNDNMDENIQTTERFDNAKTVLQGTGRLDMFHMKLDDLLAIVSELGLESHEIKVTGKITVETRS
jgi:hypothetical protein